MKESQRLTVEFLESGRSVKEYNEYMRHYRAAKREEKKYEENVIGNWRHKTPPLTLTISYQHQAVAELTKENGKFLFRYLEPFFAQDLSPLPGLAPTRSVVTFAELPAFFRERLPDVRRPEIKQYIRDHNIDENDELKMLACLGKRSITDSFELRLSTAAA